jgi:cation diffusion facilitator family transporter
MHRETIDPWRHDHRFLGRSHDRHERRTWIVVALTAATMVAEIAAGLAFGSMALLADGLHMATHAGALALSGIAYALARRYADSARFSFGTGKFGDLAAWSSALVLLLAALGIAVESTWRLVEPAPIRFDEAIAVAVVGLLVNLASAALLHDGIGDHHHHDHDDDHHHEHETDHERHGRHAHRDHNIAAAYAHVVTDAATSVAAILALLAGRIWNWLWLDAVVGLLASGLVAAWAVSLLRRSGAALLDCVPDPDLAARIRARLEQNGDRVADLHLWRLGPGHLALVVSIVSDAPAEPDRYKARLRDLPDLSHVTIEVHPCTRHRLAA